MNLLLVEASEVTDGRVVLVDRRAEHLNRVLKVRPGDTVRVGLVGAGRGRATVASAEPGQVELELEVDETPAPRPVVDLVVGLPRPQVLHRVLQFASSMGVGELHLVNAWRVEKSFFQSPSVRPEKIRHHLWLGAEQGCSTHIPEVHVQPLLVPFLRRLGAETGRRKLLAHVDASAPLERVLGRRVEQSERILVAIGPEGGWIDREVQTFGEEGFEPVWLGPWVLKVEAAVTAALAQIDLLRRMVD